MRGTPKWSTASSPRCSRWISLWVVVCLALAVYAVVVQRALAKFRAKGPMMYYLMYIVNTAVTVLYLLIGSIIIGQSVFTAEVAGSIIGSLVMLFVNIPYFNNRKHLFVNP